MQIVIFELGGERYCIETSNVQGIDKISGITEVPCAPSYIKGLINLRGSIISVIDPYVILNIDHKDSSDENIMILGTDGEISGIIVDRVIEVVDIEESTIKNVSISREGDKGYLKGVINMEDSLVTLVDVNALLNYEQ